MGDIKITRALAGNSFSAKTPAATAWPQGIIVNLKGSTVAAKAGAFDDTIEWELPTAKRGYLLERELLNATSVPLDNLIFTTGITSPELAGNVVSARQVQEYEVEGADLLLTTTAQALSNATAVGAKLTTVAGKLALITDAATQEEFGVVRGQLAPQVTGNTFRLLVEVSR